MRYSLRDPAWLAAVTRRAWSPLDLAPDLWLDASDASTITDAGAGKVSEWRDKSGNARHMLQTTAGNRPTTGTRSQNGLNVIDFVRASAQFLTAGDILDLGLNALSIFAVVKFDDLGSGGLGSTVIAKSEGAPVAGRFGLIRLNSQTYAIYSKDASADAAVIANDTSLSARVLTQVTQRIAPPTSSTNVLRVDGVQIGSDAFVDVASSWNTAYNLNVGRYGNTNTYHHDGFIGELIFLRRTATNAERDLAEAYLKAKWGTA